MVRGREVFKKYKKIINCLSNILLLLPKKVRISLFNSCRMIKGKKGLLLRYLLLSKLAKKCGDNVSIHPGVYLFNIQNLEIGDNVSIHPMCYIDCAGGIKIGNDVSIAHNVTILSSSHNYENIEIPIKDQGLTLKEVIIENNVWIGAKVTILYGKTIESGSIIGANCLVTKNVKKNTIVGGNPNKVIKERC